MRKKKDYIHILLEVLVGLKVIVVLGEFVISVAHCLQVHFGTRIA